MTDTIRDGLLDAIKAIECSGEPGCELGVGCLCLLQRDAALAYLREAVPGFDALLGGEAVVVPKEPNTTMTDAAENVPSGIYEDDDLDRAIYRAMLAASPFAGKKD